MPHQFPQATQDLGIAVVEFPGADGGRERVLVGVAQQIRVVTDLEEFPLDFTANDVEIEPWGPMGGYPHR